MSNQNSLILTLDLFRKLKLAVGLCLLMGFTAIAQAEGKLNIAKSPNDIHPVKTGERVPAFMVKNPDGNDFYFGPDRVTKPTVLILYRGGWCPYCNVQLQDLRKVLPQIRAKGAQVLFISGDRPDVLYSSLKEKTKEEIHDLNYKIYSDADMQASSALGVAFSPSGFGIHFLKARSSLKGSSLREHDALPVPSVFVVDTSGVITYAFTDPDFKIRLPAEDVLKAVDTAL